MSLNKFMHPRNLYKKRKPNFKELALKYPEFRNHLEQNLSGKLVLDFKNPAALRLLSTILLKEDFELEVDIPPNRLVPTIPLRLNYIHWIEDLLSSHHSSHTVQGIDIGTGSCCIYPLLGQKLNGWKFLATELDAESAAKARQNVEKNNFQDSITVKDVSELEGLRSVVEETDQVYDFCMCNPPFYSNEEQTPGTSLLNNRPEPHAAPTASTVERVTWGGEYRFVNQLIQDSLVLRNRVRIYTSMVGKKQNMLALKYELKNLKVPVFSSTEFCQGKTMRWGLGWSFDEAVSFTKSYFKAEKKKEKLPLALCIPTEIAVNFQALCIHIKEMLQELKINYVETKSNNWILIMALLATENTWSHQRRQRRQQLREQQASAANRSNSNSSPSKVDQPNTSVDGGQSHINESCGNGEKPLPKQPSAGVEGIGQDETPRVSSSCSFETETAPMPPNKRKRELENYEEKDDATSEEEEEKRTVRESRLKKSKREELAASESCVEGVNEESSELHQEEQQCDTNDTGTQQTREGCIEDVSCSLLKERQTSEPKEHLFQCTMFVKRKVSYIQLEFALTEGNNRELLHQLMQYFRNKLLP